MNTTTRQTTVKAPRFRLTYEVITEESSQDGEAAYRGFLPRSKAIPYTRSNMPANPATFTLREAIAILTDTHGGRNPIEADSSHLSPANPPRWLTWDAHLSMFTDRRRREGVRDNVIGVNLSMHLPRELSPSSALRIARLVGCYGVALREG